jgi:competence ComEA-like helix-hairpin-helix protein
LILVVIMGLIFPITAIAESIKVMVNNEPSTAVVEEGHTLVPMRTVLEALGADVQWNPDTNTAIGVREGIELKLPIGSIHPTINGKSVFAGVPIQLIEGMTYIPLHLITQIFDEDLLWDDNTQTIVIPGQEKVEHDEPVKEEPVIVEVNGASSEELQKIKVVDEKIAQSIIEYRNANGCFISIDQLKKVPGIDEKTFTGIKDSISIVYDQKGTASWYGAKFHGRKTSSGEVFDMHKNTAAHRTLPLGSEVEVTFLKTGKSVCVRINDRGPHIANRIIDLSKNAADCLGLTPYGCGEVIIKITGK